MLEPDHDLDFGGQTLAFFDYAPDHDGFREALLEGLRRPAKSIPCRFLYDAAGSALFDQICELPEYYPTRTEIGILDRAAPQIAERAGSGCVMIELGGASSLKAQILLNALDRPAAYIPIDISREHLRAAADGLQRQRPHLTVLPVCADYAEPFPLPRAAATGRRLGFFPGSTIGNLQPRAVIAFLADWAARLGPDAAMVVGADLRKDPAILEAAYDDAQGITARFIKNILMRANRELEAGFDLDRFAYRSRYDADHGRIEIHLESLGDQSVRIGADRIALADGERIHVEDSYKFSLSGFADLARAAGFEPAAVWTDPGQMFSVHYLTTPAA